MGTPVGSPPGYHGGWLGNRVLPFLDRRTTHAQRARLPLVAAGWTSLFVLCSLGTFLLGRGSDAQAEACAGTSYRDSGECDDRSDAAPVVSYSGILFPERAVFLFFGVPCAPLWFLTILLSHRALVGLVDAACVTRAARVSSRDVNRDDDVSDPIGGDGAASGSANEVGAAAAQTYGADVRAVYAWPLRRMEPLAVVATPLLLLVVCISLGDPQPGPAIHATAAFFFFLLGVYNAFLSLRGARVAVAVANDANANDDVQTETSTLNPARAWTPSAFFLNAQRFKAGVLLALFGAMVPVAAFWATMTYAWGGEEHMLAPTQYAWIAAMTLGNGACVGEIREWEERCGASRGGRAEGEEGTGDFGERSLADVAV